MKNDYKCYYEKYQREGVYARYRERNREVIREKDRIRRTTKEHKEKIKKYRQKNKERANELAKANYQKHKNDPNRPAKMYVKNVADNYIRALLKQEGFSKEMNTTDIIESKRLIIKIKRILNSKS